MTNPAKNPTQWFPSNRQGKFVLVPNSLFVDNLGNYIVTNRGHNIETNSGSITGAFATVWTPTVAA